MILKNRKTYFFFKFYSILVFKKLNIDHNVRGGEVKERK